MLEKRRAWYPRLVDAGDLVGDRRRPARLAGAGRAVRGGAGGARAPRRHGRTGCCDRNRRAAAGRAGARQLGGIPFGVALLLAAIPVLLVGYATSAWMVGRRVLRTRSTSAMGGAAGRLGNPSRAGPDSRRRALVGLAATVVGLGALAMALWRAGRPGARGEARGAGSGSSSSSRLTVADSMVSGRRRRRCGPRPRA